MLLTQIKFEIINFFTLFDIINLIGNHVALQFSNDWIDLIPFRSNLRAFLEIFDTQNHQFIIKKILKKPEIHSKINIMITDLRKPPYTSR